MDIDKDAWLKWCRLCATTKCTNSISMLLKAERESSERGLQLKNDSEEELCNFIVAVQKHFDVNLQNNEKLPIQLCDECFSMICTLMNFTERVRKAQKMFTAIQLQEKSTNTELYEVHVEDDFYDDDEQLVQATNEENYFETKTIITVSNDAMDSLDKNPLELKTNDEDTTDDKSSGNSIATDNDDFNTNNTKVNFTTITSYKTEKFKKSKTKSSRLLKKRANKLNTIDDDDDDFYKGSSDFSCAKCNQQFKRIQGYRIHMKMAHAVILPDPEYPCTECTRTFNTKFKLKKHQKLHTPLEQRKIIPCPHCEKKFTSEFLVRAHVKHSHMNVRTFICEECGLAVSTNATLKRHMLTHTNFAAYACHICQRRFKFQFQLTNHLETHDPKKHICAECGLQLNSRVTLSRHLLVHSDEMPHKCEYCGRAFKRWKSLKVHLVLHTGIKPYACNFCDLTFAAGTNCRVHMKKVHAAEFQAAQANENQSKEHTDPNSSTT